LIGVFAILMDAHDFERMVLEVSALNVVGKKITNGFRADDRLCVGRQRDRILGV
jgi:hypothetical protein